MTTTPAEDLRSFTDGWYGCAQQATVFLAQALVDGASLSEARATAYARYVADPARTDTVWRDEMTPTEAIDAAADFMRTLTDGEWNSLTLDDYNGTGEDIPALAALVPFGDITAAARMVAEALTA